MGAAGSIACGPGPQPPTPPYPALPRPPPPGFPAGAAQGFEGEQEGRQGFFPGATAFEGGFDGRQRQRAAVGGQQVGNGAHLLGQAGGPGLLLWF